ncbi:hypothetical protein DPMN_104147 [Dreissena polymorpha]|uniref:Uncharacterized protein n=1 Tax=Dreissena polymorpha TaxID=45954 RepID=A0A9D4HCG2_DREPO|nr:hypothetical protein DPMN_104147 [Dreissena polymorpha]
MFHTVGRLHVPFPNMEELPAYTETPIEEPVLPSESSTPRKNEETFNPRTPWLEKQNRHMQKELTLQKRTLHLLT